MMTLLRRSVRGVWLAASELYHYNAPSATQKPAGDACDSCSLCAS